MAFATIPGRLRALADEVESLHLPARSTMDTSLRLPASHFFAQPQTKDLIVLHFTAGSSAEGAVSHWKAQSERIGTAYVISESGIIHEVFEPRAWAYHLGVSSQRDRNGDLVGPRHDQRSIGIEIVNRGPLRRRGDELFWWFRDWATFYCKFSDRDRFVQGGFRGETYWASFTDAQYRALSSLVPDLCVEHGIPFELPPDTKRLSFDLHGFFKDFKGVAAHQNFRSDKTDVGPAFDWDRFRRLM